MRTRIGPRRLRCGAFTLLALGWSSLAGAQEAAPAGPVRVAVRGAPELELVEAHAEGRQLVGHTANGWSVRLPLSHVFALRAPGAPLAVPHADMLEDRALERLCAGDPREALLWTHQAMSALTTARAQGAISDAEAEPRWAVYLERLEALAPACAAPVEVAEPLAELCADAVHVPPEIRDRARTILADVLRRLGMPEEAAVQDAALGVVSRWFVVGSFDNERGTGFAQAYPPEQEPFDPSATFAGKAHQVGWRPLPTSDLRGGVVDLDALMRPDDQALAYAITYLHAAEATPVALRLGSDEAVKVWVNGALVHDFAGRRPFRPDQDAVGVVLRAGWNQVLLKVADQTGAWRFRLRVGAPAGGAVPAGVRAATFAEIAAAPTCEAGVERCEVAPTPIDRLAAQVDANPDWRGWYHLGVLHQARQAHPRTERPGERALTAAAAAAPPNSPQAAAVLLALASASSRGGEFSVNKEENARRRALERALAVYPACHRARVELAEYYRRALDSTDKAWALLEPVLKAAPRYVDARLLEVELLEDRDLEPLAQGRLRALWDELEGAIQREERLVFPPAVTRKALAEARGRKDVRRQAAMLDALLEVDRSDPAALRALALVHRERRAFGTCDTLLAEAIAAAPLQLAARLTLGGERRRRGDLDGAVEAFQGALAVAPDEAALVRALGHLEEERGNGALASSLFAQALELNPQDVELKRYVEFRARYAEKRVAFEDAWIVEPEPLIAAAKARPLDPRRPHRVLLQQEVARVNPDGTQSEFTQEVYRIENEQGARGLARYAATYSSDQRIVFQRARVWRRGGGHQDAPVGEARGGRGGEFTSYRSYSVRFPPLEPGDVVEVRYRVDDLSQGFFGDYYGKVAFFAGDQAIDWRRFVLIAPSDKELHFHTPGLELEPERRVEGGQAIHVFERRDIPAVEAEPNMPWAKEVRPQVQVSTFADWDAFARWYWGLVADQQEADPAIRAKVAELCRGAESDLERIKRIYHYVITEIRYNASWEFGIHGFKPYNAATIFARKFGDCKDKATLIDTMLEVVGIKAHPVLIFGEDQRGREDLTLPLMGHFNHCISWVDHGDGGIFLDGTAEYHPYPALPGMDYGARVVVIKPDGGVVREIPYRGPESNQVRERHAVRVKPDGGATVTSTIEGSGTYESVLRSWMQTEGRRKELLEPRVGAAYTGAHVTEVRASDVTDLEAPVRVEFDVTVPRILRKAGGALELDEVRSWLFDLITLRGGRLSSLAADAERQHDLVLPLPSGVSEDVVYQLPSELELKSVPEPVELETPFGAYRRTYTRDGAALKVKRVLEIRTTRVPQADYEAFRKFVQAVDRAERERVVFEQRRGSDE